MLLSHSLSLLLSFFLLTAAQTSSTCYTELNGLETFAAATSVPYYFNPYACTLASTNIAGAADGTYTFTIGSSGGAVTCGEQTATTGTSFGYYQCNMKPTGISGTVQSCEVTNNVGTFYESVYIKFFGNDTSNVYTGWFAQGQPYQSGPVRLTFTTTDAVHQYAFLWTTGFINWYVDGKLVTSAQGNQPIPLTPSNIVVSLVTESPTFRAEDTVLPTDPTVGRIFAANLSQTLTATFSNITYTPLVSVACPNTSAIDGNGANPDASACDMRLPFSIFQESLAKGWTSTDSTTSNFANTANCFSGTKCVSWDVVPNARLYLIAPQLFWSSQYETLEFWIYGNGFNGQQITASILYNNEGTPSTGVNLASKGILVAGVQPYEWQRVVIPFTRFGLGPLSNQTVKGFVLQSTDPTTFGGRISIDGIVMGFLEPMCANKTSNVYTDKLASGWTDQSWGVWNITSAVTAHSGSYSISWELYGSGGIKLHGKSVDSTVFTGISFWINTAQLTGWKWTLQMTADGSQSANSGIGAPINIFDYYGGNLPNQDGQWTYIVIPFYEMGITSNINGMVFTLGTDQYQGMLYIDDINFIEEIQSHSSASSLLPSTAVFAVAFVLLSLLF